MSQGKSRDHLGDTLSDKIHEVNFPNRYDVGSFLSPGLLVDFAKIFSCSGD